MANDDFFNGDPSVQTPARPDAAEGRNDKAVPVDGGYVTPPGNRVKRALVKARSPEDLLDDATLDDFLKTTSARLRRLLPPWAADCAWEGAEDAVLAVRRAPSLFPAMGSVRGYARVAAIRAVCKRRRSKAREVPLDDADEPADPRVCDALFEARSNLAWVLGRLPERHRDTVVALKGLGLTAWEFAAQEGIAQQTVLNRVHVARRMLDKALQEGEPL